jgi:hypothetical protein
MADYENKKHKVSKGETLESIAKKYGHKDSKQIRGLPENKAIIAKLGKPENLPVGVTLLIPPNEKERMQQLAELKQSRDTELAVRTALENSSINNEKLIKLYEEQIKNYIEMTKRIVGSLDNDLRGMTNLAAGVDAAKTIAEMGADLGKIAKLGAEATKATGKALADINKEALHEVGKLVRGPLEDGTAKAVSSLKENDSAPLAFFGILGESWDKMTSPSFWSQTAIELKSGKSWSDAVTMEVGDDLKESREAVLKDAAEYVKKLRSFQAASKARIAENQILIRECDARFKFNEEQARKL